MAEKFAQTVNVSSGFVPVDMQTAANNGDWVSVKQYNRVAVVLFKAAGTAADDPTLTITQADTNGGGNAKALNFTTIYRKQGTLTSVGTYTRTTQSAGNTYTNATSAEEQAIWIVEFNASELDVENGFYFLRGAVGDVGGNAQLGCLMYVLTEPRYQGESLPSALT